MLKTTQKKTKTIMTLYITLIWAVVVVILENYMGAGVSGYTYCVIVLFTLLTLTTIFLLLATFLISVAKIQYYDTDGLLKEEKCRYFNTVCCVNMAIDSLKSAYRIRLDDDIANKYNLFSRDELLAREREFKSGEIWMVSYDLTSESLEEEEAKIREYNINKGVKYRLFYINNPQQKYSEVQDNINKLDKKYKKKMKFYPYEKQISIFSFLFTLFGIIMFLDSDKKVLEAYFMLHSTNEKIKEPIYMRMSYCMERKYNKILCSIMDEARNPRENENKKTKGFFRKNIKQLSNKIRTVLIK